MLLAGGERWASPTDGREAASEWGFSVGKEWTLSSLFSSATKAFSQRDAAKAREKTKGKGEKKTKRTTGYYYKPTVLDLSALESPQRNVAFREEIFGPVVSLTVFRDERQRGVFSLQF